MSKPHNPPAFPERHMQIVGHQEQEVAVPGMTLRDYFAARAPVIPDWFQPDMPEKPKHPGSLSNVFGRYSDHPHKELFKKYWNEECDWWEDSDGEVPQSLKDEVSAHIDKLSEHYSISQSWIAEQNVQRLIQWPYYYADLMIAEQQKRIDAEIMEVEFELTGADLIVAERQRQITEEGWTAMHDDYYEDDVLARAAICYALPEKLRECNPGKDFPKWWPFCWGWWKPTPDDRIRELVKAGALIASEIDRLQRAERREL